MPVDNAAGPCPDKGNRAATVAVIGAGPAGCALACFLRMRGLDVLLFDNGKRPDLLVGESLIPAAIPHLQALGVEPAVAAVSMRKPGATLQHYDGTEVVFEFRERGRKAPAYAYNVPRGQFDQILKQRAVELGVRLIEHNATFELTPDDPQHAIRLSAESLAAAGESEAPRLLVDCTGRKRLFSRLLAIAQKRGDRNDVAYFAHFHHFDNSGTRPGQVLISILNRGWSWRIPLPDRTSVGVVLNRHAARQLGPDPAARLDSVLRQEAQLAGRARGAVRISEVAAYSNYQQMTTQGAGPGWALVGDAFGFVDPMLSPGVFMALESAALFAQHTQITQGRLQAQDYQRYCAELGHWHQCWREVIEYFYDGRMVNLAKSGSEISSQCGPFSTSRLANWHVRRVIGDLVSGVATRSRYNRGVLYHSAQYLAADSEDISRLAVQE